jgi:hypothetical protein
MTTCSMPLRTYLANIGIACAGNLGEGMISAERRLLPYCGHARIRDPEDRFGKSKWGFGMQGVAEGLIY